MKKCYTIGLKTHNYFPWEQISPHSSLLKCCRKNSDNNVNIAHILIIYKKHNQNICLPCQCFEILLKKIDISHFKKQGTFTKGKKLQKNTHPVHIVF